MNKKREQLLKINKKGRLKVNRENGRTTKIEEGKRMTRRGQMQEHFHHACMPSIFKQAFHV